MTKGAFAARGIDFSIMHHGSIVLIRPLTDDATAWLHENVAPNAEYFGNALVCEPRYLENLLAGIDDAGFTSRRN